MGAECNIYICQLVQTGLINAMTTMGQDPDADIQWWDWGSTHHHGQHTMLAGLPKSCNPLGTGEQSYRSWGGGGRGVSTCHSPPPFPGDLAGLIIDVSISGEGHCYLIHQRNPRSTCADTNWLNYYAVLSSFLSKSHRCQMRRCVCKFVLRYLGVDQASHSLLCEEEIYLFIF